jgi:Uma2 family endonuclease
MPVRGARPWPLTVAAYRALGDMGLIPENTELLYGLVYQKMPKSPPHSSILTRLIGRLQPLLPPGFLLRSEQPITCRDSEPEPDIAIVRGGEDDFWEDHPHTAELVIEVCVTSHEYDRSKLPAYAEARIKEVWFVLAPEKQIEVHRFPVNGQFTEQNLHAHGTVQSASLTEVILGLEGLFSK